eukprot:2857942-Prymnesium_polylepis.1
MRRAARRQAGGRGGMAAVQPALRVDADRGARQRLHPLRPRRHRPQRREPRPDRRAAAAAADGRSADGYAA